MTLSRPSNWLIHLAAVFGPTPGDAGQVVGVLADQGRDLGVAVRGHGVLLLHGGGRHPGQLAHPAHGVEHGARSDTSCRESRSPVRISTSNPASTAWVVSVAMMSSASYLELEVLDVERVEDLLDERQLALELVRVLLRFALYSGYSSRRKVWRDLSNATAMWVGLVAHHVDEHRGEAVDGVGVLSGRRREVLHGSAKNAR